VTGVKRLLRRLVQSEKGQSLAEYGALVALMSIGLLSLLSLLYEQVAGIFGGAAQILQNLMAR
jgi:Flp pilus assembly pilin Flp